MTASILVPILTTSNSLHFASVNTNPLARDIIAELLRTPGLKEDILGDILDDSEWALQAITREEPGKVWLDEELNSHDDG